MTDAIANAASNGSIITLQSVSKRFGPQQALNGCSLKIGAGEKALLLGANGSGKSTLLRIVAGLTRADSGTVGSVSRVAFLGHELHLYPHLSVGENLQLTARLLRADDRWPEQLALWRLEAVADRQIGDLSRGTQYRAALARIFLGQPAVLVLDEPTSYLDQASSELLLERLEALLTAAGHGTGGVLMASHDVHRMRNFFSRLLLIRGGSIALDSAAGVAPEEVLREYAKENR